MSKSYSNRLPQLDGGLFLTDGGIETTLIFLDGIDLPYFAVALVLLLIVGIRTQKLRFPLFSLTAAIAIPVALIKLGVFPFYYGWMLIVLLTILIFSMLSKLPQKSVLPLLLVLCSFSKSYHRGAFPAGLQKTASR